MYFDIHVLSLNGCHTAYRALQEAHNIFPGKTNMDMIFGRPYQTHDTWVRELEEVCDSSPWS